MTTHHPCVRVLDRAIKLIDTESVRFCCYALEEAVRDCHVGDHESLRSAIKEYQRQFELYAKRRNGGPLPGWWSQDPWFVDCRVVKEHLRLRRLYIRGFRQACIDAAAEEHIPSKPRILSERHACQMAEVLSATPPGFRTSVRVFTTPDRLNGMRAILQHNGCVFVEHVQSRGLGYAMRRVGAEHYETLADFVIAYGLHV